MKDDERQFLIDVYQRCRTNMEPLRDYTPRDLINEPDFPMHYKRAWYLLDKWLGKGWYDYGVTLDLGWLTDKGIEVARGLI